MGQKCFILVNHGFMLANDGLTMDINGWLRFLINSSTTSSVPGVSFRGRTAKLALLCRDQVGVARYIQPGHGAASFAHAFNLQT